MIVQTIKEGPKNLSILIKGWVYKKDFGATPILDLDKLEPPREGWKGLRLDSAVWAVQEKLGLYLWWADKGEGDHNLVLVMESRNSMRFEDGITSPRKGDEWQGKLYLSSFNAEVYAPAQPKAFVVILDFDKQ